MKFVSRPIADRVFGTCLAAIVAFAVLARGGHDLWSSGASALFAGGLLIAVLLHRAWPGENRRAALPLAAGLIALLAAGYVSWRGAVAPAESRQALQDAVTAALVFVTAANLGSAARAPFFITGVLLLIAEAAIAAAQVSQGGGETPGTLVNANALAGFVLVWIPLLIRWARAGAWRARRAALPLSGLAASVILLALTRSVWAGACLLVALPALIALAGGPRPGPWAKRLALGFAAALVLLMALEVARVESAGSQHGPRTLFAARVGWWTSALRMFTDHPVAGIGVGNFNSAYLASRAGPVENTRFAHSLLFRILAETGLLGLTAAAFALLAWVGAAYARPARRAAAFRLGVWLALGFSLTQLNLDVLANLLVLAVVLAAALRPRRGRALRMSVAVVVSAILIGGVPAVVSPGLSSVNVVSARADLATGTIAGARAALGGFRAAIELDPLSADAQEGLALARLALFQGQTTTGDLYAAVRAAARAAELDRLNADRWGGAGELAVAAANLDEARRYFERAVAARPLDLHWRERLEEVRGAGAAPAAR
jgi:O-antigen ligase